MGVSRLKRTMYRLMVCFSAALIIISMFPYAVVNSKGTTPVQSHDTVEIVVSFPGLRGFGNRSISISEEKYEELEKLFNRTLEALQDTKTDRDVFRIYDNAIEKLKELGILKDFDAEKIKKVIKRRYLIGKTCAGLLKNANKESNRSDNSVNTFCFVCGIANGVMPMNIVTKAWDLGVRLPAAALFITIERFFDLIEPYVNDFPFLLFAFILGLVGLEYVLVPIILSPLQMFIPVFSLSALGALSFGMVGINLSSPPEWKIYTPSHGIVWTSGANGVKIWNGQFVGNISLEYYPYYSLLIYLETIAEQMMENSSRQGLGMLLQLLSTILWTPAIFLYYGFYEFESGSNAHIVCFPHGVIGYSGILIRRSFMRCGLFLGYASTVSIKNV